MTENAPSNSTLHNRKLAELEARNASLTHSVNRLMEAVQLLMNRPGDRRAIEKAQQALQIAQR